MKLIEMVFSHNNPHEHNLQILRDRTLKFDARFKTAFLYDTEEEKALFDQLNFAYIGGGYRNEEEFPVTQAKIDFWRKEVEMFLELTEKVCFGRFFMFFGYFELVFFENTYSCFPHWDTLAKNRTIL